MRFDYRLQGAGRGSRLAARGAQEIACMRLAADGRLVPEDLPVSLVQALRPYAAGGGEA
jgi:hypothetical protein